MPVFISTSFCCTYSRLCHYCEIPGRKSGRTIYGDCPPPPWLVPPRHNKFTYHEAPTVFAAVATGYAVADDLVLYSDIVEHQ